MRKSSSIIVLVVSVLAMLSSCTVKEDREFCPCWLDVFFEDGDRFGPDAVLIGWTDRAVFRDTVDIPSHQDGYSRQVEKGFLNVSAVHGLAPGALRDRYAVIPFGSQSDSVWSYAALVDARGESAEVGVRFRKQFATVYLDIRKSAEDLNDYRFIVEGESCGFDVVSGEPLKGSFRHEPAPMPGSTITSFRLPRQGDGNLSLGIMYEDEDRVSSQSNFPLGAYILSIGYDWKSEDLQDIFITVDIVNGRINIGVDDWESDADFDMGRVEL